MKYQINKLPYFAENTLSRITRGAVHSVYRRTINLTDGKHILALQADGSPLSPISLICSLLPEDMEMLAVKAQDSVIFGENDVTIFGENNRSFCFTYADADRYDLKLSKAPKAPLLPVLSSNIRKAFILADTDGFPTLFLEKDDNNLSFVLLAAKKYMQRSSRLCLEKNYAHAAHELSRLLGLGIGLTPSGDDFLCGVLAGLFLSGKNTHPLTGFLKTEIREHLTDTIDISAAFLACALEKQFSLPVNRLCTLPSPEEIRTQFQAIGHSSGMDTLCGILFSLSLSCADTPII